MADQIRQIAERFARCVTYGNYLRRYRPHCDISAEDYRLQNRTIRHLSSYATKIAHKYGISLAALMF